MHVAWKGSISFGLVSIPVQLYAATEEHGYSFRHVHAADGGRIRYRRVCETDGADVPLTEVARAAPLPGGGSMVLTDEDLACLPLATSRAIEVVSFAGTESVDPIRLALSYYCEPFGSGLRPYVLLRETLLRTERVAFVKVALRQRESLAVLRAHGGVLVLQLMLWPDEVQTPDFPFLAEDVALSARELGLAETLVGALTGRVDAAPLTDEYQAAVAELIEAKLAGARPAAATAIQAPVMDLAEALRQTVEAVRLAPTRPPDWNGQPTGVRREPAGGDRRSKR